MSVRATSAAIPLTFAAKELVAQGLKVRGTVRSKAKGDYVKQVRESIEAVLTIRSSAATSTM